MPKVYDTDNELWEAYRTIISAIREKLKDLLTGGNDRAITGKDSSLGIIPHVTGMYKAYAAGIREVSRHQHRVRNHCAVFLHQKPSIARQTAVFRYSFVVCTNKGMRHTVHQMCSPLTMNR